MLLPSNYKPLTPEQFIGPARAAAEFLTTRMLPLIKATPQPWRLLFTGPPGVGKSALCAYLVQALCGNGKWDHVNVEKLNGRQANTEAVLAVTRAFHHTSLFPGARVVVIEELDKMPVDARSLLLTAVDDMPKGWLFLGTTNLTKAEMVALHEATASRYEFYEIAAPTDEEVQAFLGTHWPAVPEAQRKMTATCWRGNVRGALQELNSYAVAAFTAA